MKKCDILPRNVGEVNEPLNWKNAWAAICWSLVMAIFVYAAGSGDKTPSDATLSVFAGLCCLLTAALAWRAIYWAFEKIDEGNRRAALAPCETEGK